jgi:uncharacterized protein (TIGR03067 family)
MGFYGKWILVESTIDGSKLDLDSLPKQYWSFGPDFFRIDVDEAKPVVAGSPGKLGGHVVLRTEATPNEIDLVIGDKQMYRGIYQKSADELVMCFPSRFDGERPKEFVSNPGSGVNLHKLRKAENK